MKKCFKCGINKPLEEFYAHPMMSDGRLNKCKECARVDTQIHYRKTKDERQKYERERNNKPARRKARRRYSREHQERYPQKRKARTLIGNAVRDGKITPGPCEKCGAKAEAHHDDYSKPLEVRWLCLKHHREHHRSLA